MGLKLLDLFAGIGGMSLGFEATGGFETSAFCEIENFQRAVLAKHWRGVPIYDDVRNLTGDRLRSDGVAVDIISGGFPCQDLSSAGNMRGIGEGTRSGLFSQIIRLAVECGRPLILFENVGRLLSGPQEAPGEWFSQLLGALAAIRYDAEWFCITAASVGAPHERDRIWIVAYPNEAQLERGGISRRVYAQHADLGDSCWGKDKPGVERASNGLPKQMDRVGAIGNSVVPLIPQIIAQAILDTL